MTEMMKMMKVDKWNRAVYYVGVLPSEKIALDQCRDSIPWASPK